MFFEHVYIHFITDVFCMYLASYDVQQVSLHYHLTLHFVYLPGGRGDFLVVYYLVLY